MTFAAENTYIAPMLTDLEKQVVASLQDDFPVTERPYLEIAQQIGIPETRLLEIVASLCDRGVIRRFGATIRHQKSGFSANAMAAWQVDEERVDEVGRVMASFREVSHCYRRNPSSTWPYNLYTMVHAKNEAMCRATVEQIAAKAEVDTYQVLFSRRELKKTSMIYFPENNPLP